MLKKEENNTSVLNIDVGDLTFSVFETGTVEEKQREEYYDSHFHTMFEFQYIQKESITVVDEAKEDIVKTDEYIIIPPGIFHAKKNNDNAVRYTLLFSIVPNKEINKDFSEYCYYANILSSIKGISLHKSEEISSIMEKILKLGKSDLPQNIHIFKIYLAELLTSILYIAKKDNTINNSYKDDNSLSYHTPEEEYLKFVIEGCIQSDFAKNNISAIIAEKLNMSNRNCIRIIKNLLGESLTGLIIKQRMKLAKTLILKTDRTLTDISEAVGYNSYVAFFTAFKKYYGVSPVVLRNDK